MRGILFICSFLSLQMIGYSKSDNTPTGLTVNFLTHADQVFLNGYPVNTPLYKAANSNENYQFAEIAQKQPFFGWIVNSCQPNTIQTAYRILVASSIENILNNTGDYWDTGKSESDESANIIYAGKVLNPGSVYFWKVKTWDNHGIESSFSAMLINFRPGKPIDLSSGM